jgi:drug/metabolite transporter (DMT)-like permease
MVVYVGWSSTYLAIRVAVRDGAGFPPFTLGGMRVLAAGLVLLVVAIAGRNRLRLSSRQWLLLAASAMLLWAGGNGLVVWGEQRADSSFAALIVGSTPIWVALMESALDRRPPTPLLMASLFVGFIGLAILIAPRLQGGADADVLTLLALIGSPICWGAGSLLQSRRPLPLAPLASSGLQHLIGAVGFAVLILMAREPAPHPTPEAWWAWGYLVVFGSIITFTSFIQALRLLPPSIVFTYTYVNPVGAVFLGWLVLHEAITVWTLVGAALVLLGVAGVFRERQTRGART